MSTERDRVAYSRREAAAAAGVSVDVITRACKSGALIEHFPTTKSLILRDDLVAWIANAPTERAS